jgi:hypothetical protein
MLYYHYDNNCNETNATPEPKIHYSRVVDPHSESGFLLDADADPDVGPGYQNDADPERQHCIIR